MNISLTFKNFEPSDHLRKYAARRFEKLQRFIPKSENVEMAVVLTVDKLRHKADVQFTGGTITISAVEESADMYATVDMVLEKVKTQLKKQQERLKEHRHVKSKRAEKHLPHAESHESDDVSAYEVNLETTDARPLSAEEAYEQFTQHTDDVLVFFNIETHRINILYRRDNGKVVLVDPKFP